jgi:hypothetical protein
MGVKTANYFQFKFEWPGEQGARLVDETILCEWYYELELEVSIISSSSD